MAREIPEVVRAAAGLAATVLDEARKLPETLPGLPVRVIGLAMQQAMKAQQTYAGFVARGDELFTGLRGEDEPGLATFDDDEVEEEPLPSRNGYRESAFDRAADTEPTSASADLIVDEQSGDEVDEAHQMLDALADEAPDTETILDEIAIDEMVDQAPTLEETTPAPPKPGKKAAAAPKPSAADTLDAEPTADVATTVDVLTPAGDVAAVEATVTDEGVAAPEAPADAEPAPAAAAPASENDAATATDEGGSPVAAATGTPSQVPGAAPVDGYDSFTVAQLRGRLRGYTLTTVRDLVAYEEATRARAPYLTMLRNRLEKLEEQAIESSPLAPRGA